MPEEFTVAKVHSEGLGAREESPKLRPRKSDEQPTRGILKKASNSSGNLTEAVREKQISDSGSSKKSVKIEEESSKTQPASDAETAA